MKNKNLTKILIAAIVFLQITNAIAQNADEKWGLGFHAALIEPKTSLGNEFFKFTINSTTVGQGLSLNRYLNKSFDAGLFALSGKMSQHLNTYSYSDFVFALDLRLRYKLYNGYILNEDAVIGPYLTAGLGMAHARISANGETEGNLSGGKNQLDLYAGAGLRFRLNEYISLDWQTGAHMPSDNTWDANTKGDKDQFLEHSLGLIINLGQGKDSDGDGVTDRHDKCPNTPPGVKVNEEDGCPLDRDLDGVADYQDDCPDIAGVVTLKGCPDKDKDGVADKDDRCPEISGLPSLGGCPDADKDGIADLDDKCPGTKSGYKVDLTGCPLDSDGDGVVNEEDDCPSVKGLVALKGCPDSDGDGIADKDDKCPTVPGIKANNGCPELPKEIVTQITKIASKIFFETGSDKLKQVSKVQLDELAGILKKYPEAKLSVEGHTDNVGNPEKNVTLSQKRCESVKTYLIVKGVDSDRLSAKGFGATQPVADNKTAEGRAKNRRVELKTEY